MSLFGNYGQKNGSIGGPLFPTSSKTSPPVVQTLTPEPSIESQEKLSTSLEAPRTLGGALFPISSKASPPAQAPAPKPSIESQEEKSSASPEAPQGEACEKFCLDMSATQFGMCKCGFDRNAHERRTSTAPLAVPKIASAARSMPETKASSPTLVIESKGKGKGKVETGSSEESPDSTTKAFSSMPVTKSNGKGMGKSVTGALEPSEPALDADRQKSSDAILQLQAVIQGSGFSPLSSDAGKEAGKHVCELPDFLQSALLTIMNAPPQKSEGRKLASVESTQSIDSSMQEPITRDDVKMQVAVGAKQDCSSNAMPKASLFKSPPRTMFKAPAVVQPKISCPKTLPTSVAPMQTAQANTEIVAAPCNNFQVDLTSSQFGMCRCGFARAAHSSLGKVNQTTITGGRALRTSSAALRNSSAPPPPSSDNTPSESRAPPCSNFALDKASVQVGGQSLFAQGATSASSLVTKAPKVGGALKRSASARFERPQEPVVSSSTSNEPGPCGAFKLDMSSNQFAMCQCGFDRKAHVLVRNVGVSVSNDSKSPSRVYTLEQLRNRMSSGELDGLVTGKLEDYLEELEFSKAFGMSMADFYKLPSWKREQAKRKVGIF